MIGSSSDTANVVLSNILNYTKSENTIIQQQQKKRCKQVKKEETKTNEYKTSQDGTTSTL